MECPQCGFDIKPYKKFCTKCGTKLTLKCPNCDAETDVSDDFCGECGHDLRKPLEPPPKDLSFDEKIEKIQKYLPKGLTDKILSQRDKIEGERKLVTVMFCDMEGFTPLVEKLGAEEAYSVMDEVYEILIHKVHDYEGTVNEMTGDGIMALFGAPIALEDAPQRAIRSAYSIHREMTRFSDKIKQEKEGIPRLKMRIGINTGPVVVGTLGNDLRVEFKAVGDTVNLASRMEDLAEPGATYVTEETFKLTEGLFRYESVGEKAIKGKQDAVKTYRVIGPSTSRTRFDVSAERGLTPFVGRDRELELLIDGFERAKQGHGQAFSIISEAGVGKSRLNYEFRKAMVNEDVTFLEGKCLSYSLGVAYHPIIDLYKSNFDIREGDVDSQIKDKVKRGLKQFDVEEASVLPYLLELLSVKDSGFSRIPMSREGKKAQMIKTMIRIPLKGSAIRPLILVIEDLHWIDKSSEEVLKYLLESISGARILLIFTYRPEFVHAWGGRSYHNQMNLNRLSNRESLSMVTYLLGTDNVDTNLEELMLDKTEGIPFYIEELIKAYKDLGIIVKKDNEYCLAKDVQDITIPSTIQDIIMARVDSLPEDTKEVLQTGSVIEREFSYELIKQVMRTSQEDLLSHLSLLKDTELLYERGVYPESNYVFKHALTQEVVYGSILTKRKKELHGKTAEAIEELYIDNMYEHYEVLVEHYIKGENYAKGAEYSRLAERKAEKSALINDSIFYSQKRVTCLEKLPTTSDVQEKLIDTRIMLALYYLQMDYIIEAKGVVDPIINQALNTENKKWMSRIHTIIGRYCAIIEEDFPEAIRHLETALKISEEINDSISMVLANNFLSHIFSWNCEFKKATKYVEKAIEINVAANTPWGVSMMKSMLSFIVHFWSGEINLAFQTSNEALSTAEESGDLYSKSLAYVNHGHSYFGKGLHEEVKEYLLKGIDYCERMNQHVFNSRAQFILGETYFATGEYDKSIDHYEKAISILEHTGISPFWIKLHKIAVENAKVMIKEKDIDLQSLYGYETENKLKINESFIQGRIGAILLNLDDQYIPDAEVWIKKAIETGFRNGMMFQLGRDYALYAELFKRKGDKIKARENLTKAIEILTECGADGWVEKYEKELAALS
ncbi:MAG: AAA family ATPase [Desulfobacteraceae bacterium]|nr:AAA family ATPase [Desulfobacteraceae bacterium]